MLLEKLFENVENLNSLNAKVGSSDVWSVDSSLPYWIRIYQKNSGLVALFDAYDIRRLLGQLDSYLIGVEKIDGELRFALYVHKSFFEI